MNSNQPKAIYLARWLQHRSMGGITQKDIEASDELKRLHFKNEALETENATLQSGYDAARLEIASLQAKLAAFDSASAVRRDADAARYRWLRNEETDWYVGPSYSTYNDNVCDGEYRDFFGVELDKAIDAARAAQGGAA